VEAGRRRARAVGGELQHRRIAQLVAPVGELRFQPVAGEPLALPHGEVGVLDGEVVQRRLLPARVRLVQGAQLAQQHADGPRVADDVVHGQEEDVLLRRKPEQLGVEERPGRQVEGAPRLGRGAALQLRLPLRLGEPAQVAARQFQRAPGEHHLHRLPLLHLEHGAQHLVPPHDLAQGAVQRVRVQRPLQQEHGGDVVERVPRVHLVHEPEALLGERERKDEDFLLVLRPGEAGLGVELLRERVHLPCRFTAEKKSGARRSCAPAW
jgi:hypothetical protein